MFVENLDLLKKFELNHKLRKLLPTYNNAYNWPLKALDTDIKYLVHFFLKNLNSFLA